LNSSLDARHLSSNFWSWGNSHNFNNWFERLSKNIIY
jgi:hypothetical protein